MEEILGMAIVIAHEGLASPQNILSGNLQICRNDALESQGEDISCSPLLRIVKFVPYPEKELKCSNDFFVGNLRESSFFDKRLEIS